MQLCAIVLLELEGIYERSQAKVLFKKAACKSAQIAKTSTIFFLNLYLLMECGIHTRNIFANYSVFQNI